MSLRKYEEASCQQCDKQLAGWLPPMSKVEAAGRVGELI